MASNKKPSIYSDRGSIGSTEELDEYGVWIKSEPQVLSAENSDLNEVAAEEETLSIDDTAFDIGEPEAVQNSKYEDIEFPDDDINIDSVEDSSAEMDMEDFNIDDSDDISEIDTVESKIDTEEASFDDLSASEEFATADFGVPTVKSIENGVENVQDDLNAAVMKGGDLSTQLLLKIANELSSIRSELQDLKKEFAGARAPVREEEDETIALTGDELDNIISDTEGSEQVPETEEKAGGFFTDEEDDTIALTGDELDNIVNSADFTEESGVDETPESEFSLEEESDTSEEALSDTPLEEPSVDEPLADEAFENLTEASLSLDDDLLNNSLVSDDMSAADLMADFGDTAEDADIAESIAESIAEETPLTEDEIDEELIDIDIESLNIDLDPETLLNEASIEEEGALPAEEEISLEELADDLSLDETLDIKADDDIDLDLGSDIDFDDNAFADISEDSASANVPLDDVSLDDVSVDEPLSDISSEEVSEDMPEDVSPEDEPVSMDDFLSLDTSILEDDAPSMDDDLSLDTSLSMDDDLSLDTPLSEDDLNLDDSLSENDVAIGINEEDDAEELKKLRDEGAKPLTFPPDNSSYLEDEDLNPDSFDLSDAVIDEPEMLSTDNISDNLIEPSLDDMDSIDDLTIDEAMPEEEVIPLSADDLDIEIPAEDAFAVDDLNDSFMDDSFDTDTFDIAEPIQEEPTPEPAPKPVAKEAPKPAPAPVAKEALKPAPAPVAKEALKPAPAPVAKEAPKPAPKAEPAPAPAQPAASAPVAPPKFALQAGGKAGLDIPKELKTELRSILSYMDQLLESLPDEKIEEFAKSEYFDSYRKLFKDLGLV